MPVLACALPSRQQATSATAVLELFSLRYASALLLNLFLIKLLQDSKKRSNGLVALLWERACGDGVDAGSSKQHQPRVAERVAVHGLDPVCSRSGLLLRLQLVLGAGTAFLPNIAVYTP
jgi:hypothetical protein